MKTENLSKLINIIKAFTTTNFIVPILSGVKIQGKGITVTDLGVMVEVNMDMEGCDGVIDKKLFCSAVTSIKDFGIKVDKKGNYLISNKTEKVKIVGQPVKDFSDRMIKPKEKEVEVGTLCKKDIKSLMIASRFAGSDDLRPIMLDVFFESEIAGTDASRLYWVKAISPLIQEVRFPKLVCKILKIIGGEFTVSKHGDNIASCKQEDFIVSFRLREGKYPNYRDVIPTDFSYTVEFNVSELKDIADKVLSYGDQNTMTMKISIDGDKVSILGEDIDFGNSYSAEIEPVLVKNELDGKKMDIGINASFIGSILRNLEEETVTIKMSAPNKAMVLNDSFLLMPVMLTS